MQLMSDLSHPLSAAALGTLDFSLLYDQENNALHCTISKAKVGPRAPTVPRPRVLGEGLRWAGQFPPLFPAQAWWCLCCVGAEQGEESCLSHLSCPKMSAEGGIWGKSSTKKGEENERMKAWVGLSRDRRPPELGWGC